MRTHPARPCACAPRAASSSWSLRDHLLAMAMSKPPSQWPRLRLAILFTGIDGPGTCVRKNGWPVEINNIVEVKANLCPYLSHVMGRKIAPRDIMLVQKPRWRMPMSCG